MIRNYLLVAIRNLQRNRTASILKVISLSVGMISFAIIFLFVRHELSFDRFHRHPEQVYRVVKDFINDDGSHIPDATTPPALAPSLQEDAPQVASVTRIFPGWGRKYLMEYGNEKSYEENVLRIDSSFFDVFSFPFVKGDKEASLRDPHFILLTESTAKRLFGDTDPTGKTIHIDIGETGTDLAVTGVLKDVPENSHFTFDFLISLHTFNYPQMNTNWGWYNYYTYVRLKDGADPVKFQSELQPLFNRYNTNNVHAEYYAQALTDIHLHSRLKWELSTNGDASYVNILSIIAIFTLMLAVINYVNLVTAQSARRAREVGVRKVAGAVKRSLVKQFLLESVILSLTATILSLAFAETILPLLQEVLNAKLSLFDLQHNNLVLIILGVGTATGLLAGIYPAFVLSSFQPAHVLKGKVLAGHGGESFLRKSLVTFQFIISTVLIMGMFVITGQTDYIRNKNLGFDKENIMLIGNAGGLSNMSALLNEIRKAPGVTNAGSADGVIGAQNWTNYVSAKGSTDSFLLNFLSIDTAFLPVMGVDFIAGRNFSTATKADSTAIILNETAVREMGLEGKAVGSQILWGTDNNNNPTYNTVIGVIKDFHFTSFHEPIKPFGFIMSPQRLNTLFVKTEPGDLKKVVAKVSETWTSLVPQRPFEYTFQDEQVAKLYVGEVRFEKLFSGFTFIAILVAALGLFGLSAFAAQQRTKEIGIRKALGASIANIIQLLSNDFMRLIIIAIVISVPVAWYAMSHWLENFAYHITIGPQTFIWAGLIAIGIALLAVSFQSIRAAVGNPTKALRNE